MSISFNSSRHRGAWWEQLRDIVDEAEARYTREAVEAEIAASVDRRAQGWEQIEAAYASPNASEMVTEGRWAGFSRADATAWCWNLFQYEPRGFVHPGSEVRIRALRDLEAGGLPEVFGYPERAREHEERGLTPRKYRECREALGATVFSPSQVIRR